MIRKLFLKHFEYFAWLLNCILLGKPFPIDIAYLSGSRLSGKTQAIATFIVLSNRIAAKLGIRIKAVIIMKKFKDLSRVYGEIMNAIYHTKETIVSKKAMPLQISLSNLDIDFENLYTEQDSKANLKGLTGFDRYQYGIVWAEECDQIKQQDWASILEAVRGIDNILKITSSNPLKKKHWLTVETNRLFPFRLATIQQDKDMFKYIKSERTIVHYSCLYGNEGLTAERIAQAERNSKFRTAGLVDTVLWGAPGQEQGAIYADIVPLIQEPSRKATQLTGGVDFGYKRDATAAHVIGKDAKRQKRMVLREFRHDNAVDPYAMSDRQQFDVVKFFVSNYRELRAKGIMTTNWPMYVYCDSADLTMIHNLNNELKNNQTYSDLHKIITFSPSAKMKVKILDRIDKVRREIKEGILEIDSEHCPWLLLELENAEWSDKEGQIEQKRLDGDDHSINSLEMEMIMEWNVGALNG